jgi:signal transduction histidine kinase
MRFYPRSLRKKIIYGYVAGVVLVMGFVLLAWSNLNTLQEMVVSGDVVSDLFDATLEIRRFEKNYFLYETEEDYRDLVFYVERADELLDRRELTLFARPSVIRNLDDNLSRYRELLTADFRSMMKYRKLEWEKDLRSIGKEIVNISERISDGRKIIKRRNLANAKGHLLIGIVLLMLAGVIAGVIFYKKAVKPLSVLEQHMNRISDGEFSLIDARFKDSELSSLKIAFNKMLLELQARQGHLVQSEKLASMGTLVFGVAHELNNPLSNIYTSSQILKEELEDDDVEFKRELISQIESETERAKDVVGSVLDYSRTKEKTAFNLRRAMDETVRLMKAEVPPKIHIVSNIPEDLKLYADKQKIQQVILNLIKNAIDAMPGEGEVSLSASRDGHRVEIVIQDDGAGMDHETLSKVFDPFFSSKKNKKGYGLGLFIVHNIIEEHGGNISVDSSPNVGTVFTINLPAEESQDGKG